MAQLVLIASNTVRTGQNLGDLVSIHEDDVPLTGSGYASFRIIKLKGISAPALKTMLSLGATPSRLLILPKFKFNLKSVTKSDFDNFTKSTGRAKTDILKKIERRYT